MAGTVRFKVIFIKGNDTPEVKTFEIDGDVASNFIYLEGKLGSVYPILQSNDFTISWKDANGDTMTISGDEGLRIALSEMSGEATKKFYVILNSERGRTTPSVENTSQRIHTGIRCDICNGNIEGFRYKCLQCRDYDLCANCEAEKHHSQHCMLRSAALLEIRPFLLYDRYSERMNEFVENQAEYWSRREFEEGPVCCRVHLEAAMMDRQQQRYIRRSFDTMHVNVTCDGCMINVSGFRYKCIECRNYDLCEDCAARGLHPQHRMIRSAFQLRWTTDDGGYLIREINATLMISRTDNANTNRRRFAVADLDTRTEENRFQREEETLRRENNNEGTAQGENVGSNGSECVVCLSSPATHAFLPCGHRSCCDECSTRIYNGEDSRVCPTCRTRLGGPPIRIFL